MSFRSIVRDVRDGFGSLSRRSFDVRLTGLHSRGKSQGSVNDLNYNHAPLVVQTSRWANLPPELLCDVIKRLEESESTWPERKHVVACAAVCKSWRSMCKEIVGTPETCGKLTFPVSLKQPGPRDTTIQCYIKRDKSNLTYHLFLCLNPAALLVENGKFLLSAKRTRRTTCTEYVISMDADHISRSSGTYVGKLRYPTLHINKRKSPLYWIIFNFLASFSRSNFLGTKFIIYDTQPPHSGPLIPAPGRSSRRFYSKKVSPKVPNGSYNIAHITYELNVLGTRGPRKMHCIMHSIPTSALEPGGFVPGQPELVLPHLSSLEDSFRSISFSKSLDRSTEFSSSRFSEIVGAAISKDVPESEKSKMPLVLKNKAPRWHEQLQCWCLNFRGRVTIASVKNFQLIAAQQPPPAAAAGAPPSSAGTSQPTQAEPDKVILQFGKVGKDMFTMDYRYPLSAFQAFAICLSSFDTKLACE
ncbi:putative transcription factor TUBBY family [Helianthus annuus]|nr:putative transcription factor TUBBY family [Helianthus annuus]